MASPIPNSSGNSVLPANPLTPTTSGVGNRADTRIISASSVLLQQCRLRQELALDLVREKQRVSGFQATQQLASAQICGVVADVGAEILREALIANPLNYFRMLNAFSRIAAGGLKCERHLADEAVRKALLERKTQRSKKGITRNPRNKWNPSSISYDPASRIPSYS